MSVRLLYALDIHTNAKRHGIQKDFTFQHTLCHDFESLVWVIVYAMMVRRKSVLAATDSKVHPAYKEQLDNYWGVHSHSRLAQCHNALIGTGSSRSYSIVEDLLFTDPFEAGFFRDAMRLLRSQVQDEEPITYKQIQGLFRTHIQKAEQAAVSTLTSA